MIIIIIINIIINITEAAETCVDLCEHFHFDGVGRHIVLSITRMGPSQR